MISRAVLKRALEQTFGAALIVLGIAGLVLPVLPGIVLIVAGLAVLSSHSRIARWVLESGKVAVAKLRRRWRP